MEKSGIDRLRLPSIEGTDETRHDEPLVGEGELNELTNYDTQEQPLPAYN